MSQGSLSARAVARSLWAALLWLAATCPSLAADSVVFRHARVDPLRTDRIIIKWRDAGVAAVQMDSVGARTQRLRETGIDVSPLRTVFGRTDVVQLDHVPGHTEMQALIAQIETNPAVEYAEPDAYRYEEVFPQTPPNDPHFFPSTAASNASNPDLNYGSWVGQWYLQPSSSTTPAAISATTAWTFTLGSPSVVVAVIDSGVIEDHPDLAPNIPNPGFDFVSCDQGNYVPSDGDFGTASTNANQTYSDCTATGSAATYDLSGENQDWNANGSDPGNWVDSTDITLQPFINGSCTTVLASDWHGTKVAGVIGAVADNGIGIAGVAPQTTILPIRVLSKCNSRVSDIAAAILYAAGQPVAVTGGNIQASPAAKIINLSLGANTPCSATEQQAISTVLGAGVLVVAAAGNEGGALDAPSNCSGVLSVVGLRHTGTKTEYSNLSSASVAATIAAPGGNCVNAQGEACLYSIETTSDASSTSPSSTPGFYTYELLDPSYVNAGGNLFNEANIGTSFAAPMVSGVAALMLAGNPSLTPAQIIARLQSSATAFPTSSPTSSTKCVLASDSTDSNGNFVEPDQTSLPECVCTTATCGAGMLNADAAIQAAEGMYAQIQLSKTVASFGEKVGLNGSGSTAATGYSIASYQWTTDPATSDQIENPNSAIATLIVPSFRSISVILTITDNAGRTATASARVQSVFGNFGGSGAWQLPWLALLALGALAATLRRRRARMAHLAGRF